MNVAVAADHRGRPVKDRIVAYLTEQGHHVLDMGTHSSKSCDYTDTAFAAARAVAEGKAERAVMICGTGIGMSIAANKLKGIRAALCHDELTAEVSRRHNDANVLCLASDVLGEELMRRIVASWMVCEFEKGGRHERRVRKIGWIEQGKDPSLYHEHDGLAPRGKGDGD